jgi:hypothetical protein
MSQPPGSRGDAPDRDGRVMGLDEAAALLGTTRDRVLAMVAQGLLHPVASGDDGLELDAEEVRAVHDLGG